MFDEAVLDLINQDDELKTLLRDKVRLAIEKLDITVLSETIQGYLTGNIEEMLEDVYLGDVVKEAIIPHLVKFFDKLS